MNSPDSPQREAFPAGDTVALVLLVALASIGAWLAAGYGLWNSGDPGPGLFPLIVCVATILFSLLSLAALVAGFVRNMPAAADEPVQEGPILWRKLLIYVGTILAWPWLLSPLGFLVSTAIALMVIVRYAEGSGWRESALLVACAAGISWLLFDRLLGVPLPRGSIGFG